MQIHEVKSRTRRAEKKVVGRGGKRGKTAGRGTKGQKARAGHRIRPAIRDIIKKLPKRRGEGVSRNRYSTPFANTVVLNIGLLNEIFAAGTRITPSMLLEEGLIEKKGSTTPSVKILGKGDITKKFEVRGCTLSASAKAAIEKAGGSVR